jgi:hypothetical protein
MGIVALIILAMSVWVVRRVTAPTAAERLRNDVNSPPLPETVDNSLVQGSR